VGQTPSENHLRWADPLGDSALITDILAQQESLQAVLGGLEISNGALSDADQVADGLVLDLGDMD
jgi:hypothetical protein